MSPSSKKSQTDLTLDETTSYARSVIANEIVACSLVKLACKRHLRDLELGAERGLRWSAASAQWRISFYTRFLRHSKGEWARKPMELSHWQKFIIGNVFGWKRADGTRRFRYVYQEVPRKNGKALAIDTPIATPTGWTRHGDLRPGDLVFGRDGTPVKVLGTTEHYAGSCYNVSFADGEEIVAHEAHEWDTKRSWYTGFPMHMPRRGAQLPLIETKQIAATLRGGSRGDLVHKVETTPVLVCETNKELELAPYTLGAWLGDGTSAGGQLTSADAEVVEAIAEDGYHTEYQGGYRYALRVHEKRWHSDSMASRLRTLGVINNKHIPEKYLRADVDQRTQLLCGLIDTDGTVEKHGQVSFSNMNERLARGVMELARSLGFKTTFVTRQAKLYGKPTGEAYGVAFFATPEQLPIKIKRKRNRLKGKLSRERSGYRVINGCEFIGNEIVNCIEVEGGYYLAGRAMVPTHNSTMLAGVGLDMLVCDEENGAEIYATATKKDQARIIFDEAKRMVAASPALSEVVTRLKLNLSVDRTSSKFEPLSSDENTLDGLNPHCVLIDELHKHRNRSLLDVMDTAVGARRQPLLWIITTAGDDSPDSVYSTENDYATKVLQGVNEDDNLFAFITTIDKGDKWDDPIAWAKANPNLGISVKLDDLERQALKASKSPQAQSAFMRLRLNVRSSSIESAIDMITWSQNGGPRRDPADLKGRRCWMGLDLSSKIDISASVKLFEPDEPGGKMIVMPRFWMPLDTLEQRIERDRNAHYRAWVDDGYIEVTPGNVVDHDEIERAVAADNDEYKVQSVAYDPWNATQLSAKLLSQGVPMVEFIQGLRSYSEPTKEFLAWLLDTKLDHGNNPVLRFMASNFKTHMDKNLNRMPHKLHSTGRIDGITALIMAIGRYIAVPTEAPKHQVIII